MTRSRWPGVRRDGARYPRPPAPARERRTHWENTRARDGGKQERLLKWLRAA